MSEAPENASATQPKPSLNRYQTAVSWCATNATWLVPTCAVLALILVLIVVKQTVELHGHYTETNWGNVAEAFGAAGTLLAVVVALWQSLVIRRQAEQARIDAAEQFEGELKSARDLHAAEMKAADDRHKAELDAQREIARVQRLSLREQEFKLALIRVSRAANAYAHELATLVAETPRILSGTSRQDRDDALKPISKQLAVLASDLTAEISGAHLLTNNNQLHNALDRVTAAALNGPKAESDFRNTTVMAGQQPNETPIFMVMAELQRVIGDTRRLAGALLVTGMD
ncbi:MAG: hypothetical protein VX424_02210 [Actinomycetota bacterium]|nr:hypothetical protein [Actinomycetota bacterium]